MIEQGGYKCYLERDIEILRMKEKESIQKYFDRLMTVVKKIRLMKEKPPDSRIVEKVFVCLLE